MQAKPSGFEVRRHFGERAGRYDQDCETCGLHKLRTSHSIADASDRRCDFRSSDRMRHRFGYASQLKKNSYGLDFSTGPVTVANEKRPATQND